MNTALSGLGLFAIAALIGCATAQEPAERGQAARTEVNTTAISSAADKTNTPRIQIADKRQFMRELARLGVSTSIADRDLIKKLFGWVPAYKRHEQNPEFVRASFAQYPEKKTNVDSILVFYATGTQESEKGGLSMSLWSDAYCIRLQDLKAALGDAHSFSRPIISGDRVFMRVTDIYAADYKISHTIISIQFEYQECAQGIYISKNMK